jgi:hypothetical protein
MKTRIGSATSAGLKDFSSGSPRNSADPNTKTMTKSDRGSQGQGVQRHGSSKKISGSDVADVIRKQIWPA